jgi:RNA polymerase sigma-70 factor (ECF subfamily)
MDVETMDRLLSENQTMVYRFVRYLGADPFVAEDLVQETFLAAFQARKTPETDDAQGWALWLRGVARNMFLRHWQSGKVSPVIAHSDYVRYADDLWSSTFPQREGGQERVEALRQCLEALAPRQREAVDLEYQQGKSRSEMAILFNMSEDGIKSLMRRIRVALGECIGRRLARQESA